MAKKNSKLSLKHVSEDEAFQLQQKSVEDLLKELRKIDKSLVRVKEKKKEDPELLKLKKKLEEYHRKHKQAELKEMENYKKRMKELRQELNEGAEEIIAETKEINRDFNNQKAPYIEKRKLIERMISEKEFKI